MTTKADLKYVRQMAKSFENETLSFVPKEEDDLNKRIKLPDEPTPEQVSAAIWQIRWDLAHMFNELLDAIEDEEEDLENLKRHRHDYSKSYSGRPEL